MNLSTPTAGNHVSYILPIASSRRVDDTELTEYLRWLAVRAEVIVVDGSPPDVFAWHHSAWEATVRHLTPDPDLVTPMGKVGGVLTGVRHAVHERLVVADDDVRYDDHGLQRVTALLDQAAVVRPQNFFSPLPWHACWDTSRTLLNRVTGGDWPGTLGVRRSALVAAGGYAGDVMFENLELVRTIRRHGGAEVVPLDLYVRRLPSTAGHFWSQRVRQAYDEMARPWRLLGFLILGPGVVALAFSGSWRSLSAAGVGLVGVAEAGRRRGGGRAVFPFRCSLWAPVWVMERSACSWLALAARARGGIPYRGKRLRLAATPSGQQRATGSRLLLRGP